MCRRIVMSCGKIEVDGFRRLPISSLLVLKLPSQPSYL